MVETTVWFGGVKLNLNEGTLKEYFMQFGAVESIILKRNQTTNDSRGFGYCKFEEKAAKDLCLKATHALDERRFDCKPAIPITDLQQKQSEDTEKKIFVAGLKERWREVVLNDYFSQFGAVETCYIAKEKGTEKSRKFGFVFFKETETVQKVMNVKKHTIENVLINVKHLMPRGHDNLSTKKTKDKSKRSSQHNKTSNDLTISHNNLSYDEKDVLSQSLPIGNSNKKNDKFKKNASFFKENVHKDTGDNNLKESNHLILNSSFLKKEESDYIVKGQIENPNLKQPSLVLANNDEVKVQENTYIDNQNNNYCNQGFENYQNNNYDYQNNQCNTYDINNYNYENNSYQAQYSNSENYNQPQQNVNYPPDYNYTGYNYYNMTNQQYLDSNQNYPTPAPNQNYPQQNNNLNIDQNAQYHNNNEFTGNANEHGQVNYPTNVYQNENQGNYQLNQNNEYYTNPEYNYNGQYNNGYYYDQSYQYGDQGYYQQYEKSPQDLQYGVQNHLDGPKNENAPNSNNIN